MTRRSLAAVVAVLALSLCTTACNGDDATPRPTSPSAIHTPAGAGPVVVMKDLAYEPTGLTVHAGESIAVENDDSAPHTFTAVDGGFDTGIITAGNSGNLIAPGPGAYDFRCTLHPSMTGTLTVQ